jgi:hypothetical protein
MKDQFASGPPQLRGARNLILRQALAPRLIELAEAAMPDNQAPNGMLGALLGVLVAIALAVFLLSGGEHLGKTTVNSDADLPPVAQGTSK